MRTATICVQPDPSFKQYRASQIPARYVHGTIDVMAEAFKNWAADYASAGGIPIISGTSIIEFYL